MGTLKSSLRFSGRLSAKKINAPGPPLKWRLKNTLRWVFIWGWLTTALAHLFSRITGVVTMTGQLKAVYIRADGSMVNYGVIGRRLVTTAFVNFLVDELQAETSEWGDFKYHDSGVGTTAAAVGDTDIETTDNESRATGTQTEGAANIYESVGTITYSGALDITEHGLFSQSTGTTLMDRHVFAAIGVVATDSIQFTYDLTVTAGG